MNLLSVRVMRVLFCTAMFSGFASVRPAFADGTDVPLPPIPGSADPGRILQNQKGQPRPMQGMAPEAPKRQAVANIPDGMDQLKFVLHSLNVEGMTAYNNAEASKLYKRYLNKEISVATVFQIMSALQQKYLDDGYALTKVMIPNQNIQGGDVKLSVLEGHVREVEFKGDIKPSPVLDDAAREIKAMHPLNVVRLERIMLIVNDLPDLNMSAVLASPTDPTIQDAGGVRVILEKNPEKERMANVTVDDHGSVFAGPLETKATMRAFHIGPNYSEMNVSASGTAPLSEQRYGSLSYALPIFGVSGTRITFSGSLARTEPGDSLDILDIKGGSQSVGLTLSYPLIRQRQSTLIADAGIEFKNARTKILSEELYDDRLRILKAGLNYNFSDEFSGYNAFDIHYSQGLDILGVRRAGSIDLSRQDGRPDFRKFELSAVRVQALPHDFEISAVASGQYSYDPLLSSEEFGFGGGQIGRGYDSSEITGDKGVSISVEIRHKEQFTPFNTQVAVQPYAFFDIGKVWNIDDGASNKISAASGGVGVRANIAQNWDLDLNFAVPLTKTADNAPKYENSVGSRVLFSISHTF